MFESLIIDDTKVKVAHFGTVGDKEQVCVKVYPKDKESYFCIGTVDDESDIRSLVHRHG